MHSLLREIKTCAKKLEEPWQLERVSIGSSAFFYVEKFKNNHKSKKRVSYREILATRWSGDRRE
jgi:hypothetical protein